MTMRSKQKLCAFLTKKRKEKEREKPHLFLTSKSKLQLLSSLSLLQLLHQVVASSRARQARTPLWFEVERSEFPIDDHSGVTFGALVPERALCVEHNILPQSASKLPARVREHRDPCLARTETLSPRGLNKGVVHGQAHDGVCAVFLQFLGAVDKPGEVRLAAGRREGPRDGKEDDFLAQGGEFGLVAGRGGVEGDVGDGVAGLRFGVKIGLRRSRFEVPRS